MNAKGNLSNDRSSGEMIWNICHSNDLATYDPYDIWKTSAGIFIKDLYNSNHILGSFPALILTLYDQLLNNALRLGYKKQEYPIVRAFAAQILLNEFKRSNDKSLLPLIENHLKWLKDNISAGYSGACWGLGFRWSAFKDVIYDANTPHATHTPYALEAFHRYTVETGNKEYIDLIKSSFFFFEKDLLVLYEDDNMMAISYGPVKDKIVTNVASYSILAYTIFLNYFPEKEEYIVNKINKLYRFLVTNQYEDGSWYYSHPEEESFIDCFHSCIILKNLLKAGKRVSLENVNNIVNKGYDYITGNFFSEKYGLYKRFTVRNKLSLTKFDLYDNAEVLNLMKMIGDKKRTKSLDLSIKSHFIKNNNIYSSIDFLGIRRNMNTLRWAVLPYLYALTTDN